MSILLSLDLMVLANLYFKITGSTQTLIFSPNTVFHFLHYSQQSLHHVYFLQFSLISVQPSHFYISLWNLQIALVTDFPGVIITTLVLFGQSKAAYWLRWYKGYVTKVFCIYRRLLGNRSQRTVNLTLPLKNLNIQKWHVYYHGCDITSFKSNNWEKWLAVLFYDTMLTHALQTFKSIRLKTECTFQF